MKEPRILSQRDKTVNIQQYNSNFKTNTVVDR